LFFAVRFGKSAPGIQGSLTGKQAQILRKKCDRRTSKKHAALACRVWSYIDNADAIKRNLPIGPASDVLFILTRNRKRILVTVLATGTIIRARISGSSRDNLSA